MKIISQRPLSINAPLQSLLTYAALGAMLVLLLLRLGPARGPVGQDNLAPVIVVSLIGFVVVIFALRMAKATQAQTVDEVIDDGDSLLIRRGREQARLNLSDIERVYEKDNCRIALALRADLPPFGRQIIFWLNYYLRVGDGTSANIDKFVVALTERCRAARRASVASAPVAEHIP